MNAADLLQGLVAAISAGTATAIIIVALPLIRNRA